VGVRALLDMHVLLWALVSPARLSARVRALLEDPTTDVLVSAASAWEIATKHRLGKLPGAGVIVADYARCLRRLRADDLPIASAHALAAGGWAVDHHDPFDRLLAAQAVAEDLPLLTADAAFALFPRVVTLW